MLIVLEKFYESTVTTVVDNWYCFMLLYVSHIKSTILYVFFSTNKRNKNIYANEWSNFIMQSKNTYYRCHRFFFNFLATWIDFHIS